jgi:hypothetical protein
MAKPVAKLFRDAPSAQRALGQLISQGYKAEEIGLLAREKEDVSCLSTQAASTARAALPQTGDTIATGPIANALSEAGPKAAGDELATALTKVLGISQEAYDYYTFGISVGGVLVSVHTGEDRLSPARGILRSAESVPPREEAGANSPGFALAARMTATNPIDAKMSGDFRRY